MKIIFPKKNNLEWLRLIFASQVVLSHLSVYLKFKIPSIINHFPGVPAFFFVSGFLIYASFINGHTRSYFENRFLRLYPALLFVTLGGGIVALFAHGFSDLINHFPTYVIWFFAQTTLGQAYNPELFRDIGVGVINGSLWTITTEILFYFFVPIIASLEKKFSHIVPILIIVSFLFYAIFPFVWNTPVYRNKTFYDIIALTPITWGWMFGFGILAVKNFESIKQWLPYFPLAAIPITIMIVMGSLHPDYLFSSSNNRMGLIYFVFYVCLITWIAFAIKPISLKFDLSYGVYIWHVPVINLMITLNIINFPLTIILIYSIAALSWFFIEKPFLKLKRESLKVV